MYVYTICIYENQNKPSSNLTYVNAQPPQKWKYDESIDVLSKFST
uniref:Uncharacterized protein n=1 Tax=Anopheles atroparvus TaxID=41427 RepID=A0AAG5DFC0_ANOAO